jgi:transposase
MYDSTTSSTYVGLDVHKDTIAVALLRPRREGVEEQTVPNRPEAVRKLVASWKHPETFRVCYEAGPAGYGLERQLASLGVSCEVVAPALVPRRPGVRIKTDRRDALNLVGLYRAGELTAIRVPSPEEEAVRDLVRLREDLKQDVLRARHRLSKFLLRQGRVYEGLSWSGAHTAWLNGQEFTHPAQASTFSHYRTALDLRLAQLAGLERELEAYVGQPPFGEMISRLVCLRGISYLSALTIACEVVDFARFASPEEFAAFVGLVPSEYSSGKSERRGSITKTGNAHVRRVLVEAAWHYRHHPAVGANLYRRSQGQPPEVLAAAWQVQVRLCGRFQRLTQRGKRSSVAVVAIARELAEAVCALMQLETAAA